MIHCRSVRWFGSRPACCHRRGPSVVHGYEIVAVLSGGAHMVCLDSGGCDVVLVLGSNLAGGWTSSDPAGIVKARMIDCGIADHRPAYVGVVNRGRIDVHHCGVIAEVTI
jgi:hypothetical protein